MFMEIVRKVSGFFQHKNSRPGGVRGDVVNRFESARFRKRPGFAMFMGAKF